MTDTYHLISSVTCPWVQRAVIMMRAKGIAFDVTYIDLLDKPDWFLQISPHGKVPVLLVNEQPLFESNAIAEFLDETVPPRLHPEDAIRRARNRAWTDFVPEFWGALGGVTYARSKEALPDALAAASRRLGRLEVAITTERGNDGPYFNGDRLSLVDAAYAPFLQRFAIAERALQTGLLSAFSRVEAWSDALLTNETVTGAVAPAFEQAFEAMLRRRETYAGSLMASGRAAE